MPSGSFSKRARNTDSIVNRKNCGGNKKAGLAPRATGPTQFRNVAFNTSPAVNFKIHKGGVPCPENYSNNPGGQCAGGVGALASTRSRGCNNLTICKKSRGNLASRYTRISSNPIVEVLIQGELNAVKLEQIAIANNHDGFKNPTEIIIGRDVTAINGDLLSGAGTDPKRLQAFGFKAGTGHQCVSIGDDAFYQCSSLTSVDIPNSVTSIGRAAFDGCSSLASVDIPNSVVAIRYRTFNGCSELASVDIPNSVTSIGDSAFSSCSKLASVDIPNSVTSIGGYAFYQCSSLASVDIPNSVTSIGDSAFYQCSSLASVVFKADINTSIGNSAFTNTAAQDEMGVGDGYTDVTTLGNFTSFNYTSDVTFSTT